MGTGIHDRHGDIDQAPFSFEGAGILRARPGWLCRDIRVSDSESNFNLKSRVVAKGAW